MQAAELQSGKPLFEGWLWKRGFKNTAWKKRWFTLVRPQMSLDRTLIPAQIRNRLYYSEQPGDSPINFILCDQDTSVTPETVQLCALVLPHLPVR